MSARAAQATQWERNFRRQMLARRTASEISQERLAKAVQAYGLKFPQSAVSRVESGERPVTLSEAYAIAEALGTSIEAMTWDEETAEDLTAELARRVAELDRAVTIAHRALSEVTL